MSNHLKFYIDGAWVDPAVPARLDVINPATEEAYTQISLGSKADVDRAVAAARAAFVSFSKSSHAERWRSSNGSLRSTTAASRMWPRPCRTRWRAALFAREAQAWAGRAHMEATIEALKTYSFREKRGSTMVVKEPIGVCALISRGTGRSTRSSARSRRARRRLPAPSSSMPSEIAPISGIVWGRDHGRGGRAEGRVKPRQRQRPRCRPGHGGHPDVDMVSFTGSTRAVSSSPRRRQTPSSALPGARRQVGQHHPCRMPIFETAVRKGVRAASAIPASPAMRRPACSFRPDRMTRRWLTRNRKPRPS